VRIRSVRATLLKERVLWARAIERIESIRQRSSDQPAVKPPPGPPSASSPPVRPKLPMLGSVLIEIETDQGLSGVGIGGGGRPGALIVETFLEPLLLGRDARDIEDLWETMYRGTFRYGQAGIVLMAMSGVDLALWDLKGRAAGEPVWKLLGGKVRERVPVYATIRDGVWAKAQGFSGIKLGGPYGPKDGPEGMRKNESYVAALRERVGPDFDIMIDCARTWDVDYTIRMARLLTPYRIRFIEEPILSTDLDGYVRLRKEIDSTLICCGEHAYTRHANRELLERGAVDILQPDIRWTGGLSETIRICDLAAKHGIPVMPHRGGMAWSLHLIMARQDCELAEGLALTQQEADYSVFSGEPVPEKGFLTVSDEPGFGLTLLPERIERFRSEV
jgi:L-rhamnonate dehydratase